VWRLKYVYEYNYYWRNSFYVSKHRNNYVITLVSNSTIKIGVSTVITFKYNNEDCGSYGHRFYKVTNVIIKPVIFMVISFIN